MVLLGLSLVLVSQSPAARAEAGAAGLKEKLRPTMTQLLGEGLTSKLLGPAPVVDEEPGLELPALPELTRKNTDASVYAVDSDLRKQGKEFDALPVEKRRGYEVAYIKELFIATRRAPAKDTDLAKWINVLEGGGSREGVYRGLVLDEVYATLESFEEEPSEKLLSWTLAFSAKYLGLSFKEEVLKRGNLFFIKRVIGEKVMDMLDALEAKPEDLRVWYAVFSAELAKSFPEVWGETLRAKKDPEVHRQWARKAHLQHIKSEVIIKLHSVMNKLQDSQ